MGRQALVTAAGQGIGRAIAEGLISDGFDVLATDKNVKLLAGLSCRHAPLDVLDREAVRQVVSGAENLELLVNCAGIVATDTVLDASDDAWTIAIDINVRSMFWTIQAALPAMLKKGRGNVINIASVASTVMGVPNRFTYSTSKAAIIGLTKSVAMDFIGRGIRANAICPGTIDTPSLQLRVGNEPSVKAAFVQRQPIGRLGTAEEIAGMARYLASDSGAFATGQVFVVDGGMSL